MQLELFGRDKMLREEIRGALVQMDVCRPEQLVDSYRELHDIAPLDWELDLLATEKLWSGPLGVGHPAPGLDWRKASAASLLFTRIPRRFVFGPAESPFLPFNHPSEGDHLRLPEA